MYKFSTAKRTPSFDDYFKKKSNRKTKVTLEGIDDEIAAMTKTAALNTPKPEALPTTGSAIKSGIQSVLSKKYGEIDTKHLFDDISDKDIEDNLETAENTIQTNIDRGMLSKNALPKLPNLRDGLALSFAAASKGNSKAATRAREAAYTESAESLVDKVKNGLSYELPKMEKAVLKTNEKPKVTNLLGDPNTKPEIEDFLMKTSLSDENKEQDFDNPLLDTDISWKSKAFGDYKKADEATKERHENSDSKANVETSDKSDRKKKLEIVSDLLTMASLIPGIDTIADLVSIPVDIAKKDYFSSVLSALGAIPIVGEFADAAKLAKATNKTVDAIKTADDVLDTAKAIKRISPSELIKTHNPTLSEKQFGELVESIRKNGITEPIKYVEYNGTKYVVDGHHRLRAAKQIGLDDVPTQEVSLPYKGYKTIDDLLWLD